MLWSWVTWVTWIVEFKPQCDMANIGKKSTINQQLFAMNKCYVANENLVVTMMKYDRLTAQSLWFEWLACLLNLIAPFIICPEVHKFKFSKKKQNTRFKKHYRLDLSNKIITLHSKNNLYRVLSVSWSSVVERLLNLGSFVLLYHMCCLLVGVTYSLWIFL